MLTTLDDLAKAIDASLLMEDLGFVAPDDWQRRVLRSTSERTLLLATRQAGKTTTVGCLALHVALFDPGLVLLVSPGLRQSGILFKRIMDFWRRLGCPVGAEEENQTSLRLANGAWVVSLPGNPETIRGYAAPKLILVDEAARVSDALFVAVAPMLATGGGRMICLTTPMGQRGQFFEWWGSDDPTWERIRVTADEIPRISPAFLAEQRRTLGERWYRQEFFCSFEQTIDQVFSTADVLNSFSSAEQPLFPGGVF